MKNSPSSPERRSVAGILLIVFPETQLPIVSKRPRTYFNCNFTIQFTLDDKTLSKYHSITYDDDEMLDDDF